jgi:Nucleotidyl transferase AbiEii toxin, Type IV TA system
VKPPRQYASAAAFRAALEARLQTIAKAEGIDLQRLRRQVSFDRLLVRLFADKNAPWLLKGGYAMELRLQKARTTKDIDLTVAAGLEGGQARLLALLQDSASVMIDDDFFRFTIGASIMDLEGAPEGGARYPVTASLAGRGFTKFHLDVGLGDEVVPPIEHISSRDWLDFAGIAPAVCPAISREQQFAEKLHAFTKPRDAGPNSRVKDLVDMALLIQMARIDRSKLEEAVRLTFVRRGTHDLPAELLQPPDTWQTPYRRLAEECGLTWSMAESVQAVAELLRGAR